MKRSRGATIIHLVSRIGFVLKGIDGVFECLGAFILLVLSPHAINNVVRILTEHELSRDPADFFSTHLVQAARDLSIQTKVFFALYLLVHGGTKLFLVAGLLRGKLWAYPVALVFMTLLIAYQLYRYSHTHSPVVEVFTILDSIVTLFIALDYYALRRPTQSHSFPGG